MLVINHTNKTSWVGFEASVLTQQNFQSIAIPFAGSAKLDWYLKLWGKTILDNDICQWAWWVAQARVENNTEQLGESHLEVILKDAYVPRGELQNPGLLKWFSEIDAIWLDNVRTNIEKLSHKTHRALAIWAGILVGNYILSFSAQTRFLRRPLSDIYAESLMVVNRIIDNQRENRSSNWEALEFIVRTKADLLYADLPAPNAMQTFLASNESWREAWVLRQEDAKKLISSVKDSFGGVVASKDRYLQLLSDMLERAKHFPLWAISMHEDSNPASLSEVIETVKKYRAIQTTYTKDMTDVLGGTKAYIITAAK